MAALDGGMAAMDGGMAALDGNGATGGGNGGTEGGNGGTRMGFFFDPKVCTNQMGGWARLDPRFRLYRVYP